jgi:hypothetical protein
VQSLTSGEIQNVQHDSVLCPQKRPRLADSRTQEQSTHARVDEMARELFKSKKNDLSNFTKILVFLL